MHKQPISIADIPPGVLSDLRDHFDVVSFKYYGQPVTQDCTSLRSNYLQIIKEGVTHTDPITTAQTTGNVQMHYLVRGEVTSNKKIEVYSILTAGEVFVPTH